MYLPTVESKLAPYLRYPKIIQRAVLLVDTHPTINHLTEATRNVLKAMLTRASQWDGRTPVKARVDVLAEQAECSTKSVQRALATFRKIGWLKEMSAGRNEWGVYCYRSYTFSDELVGLVGLPGPAQRTQMSDGAVYVDLTFQDDLKTIEQEKREANPTPVQLPPELAAITTELAISDKAVAKLRGMAHAAGHQLQDIVAVARDHLVAAKATGNRVFGYLATMIGTPSDYAGRAAKITRHAAFVAEATQYRDQEAKCRGKAFKRADGLVVRIFDGVAVVRPVGKPEYTTAGKSHMEPIYADIAAGKLVEIVS